MPIAVGHRQDPRHALASPATLRVARPPPHTGGCRVAQPRRLPVPRVPVPSDAPAFLAPAPLLAVLAPPAARRFLRVKGRATRDCMSPFLYRKLPKVNRSHVPVGTGNTNRDKMSSLSAYSYNYADITR